MKYIQNNRPQEEMLVIIYSSFLFQLTFFEKLFSRILRNREFLAHFSGMLFFSLYSKTLFPKVIILEKLKKSENSESKSIHY